ncbi:MAG TPA: hypothetical protein VKN99_24860, partial [Polyangia bacterium]|nr:hypothetical protein [Polyangia bacterium]
MKAPRAHNLPQFAGRRRRSRLPEQAMPGLGKRVVILSAVGAALCPARARGQEVTAVARGGIYADSDHTQVYRSLGAAQVAWRHFGLHAQEEVDVVSSASTDVRASPFLDALSGASPVSPTM